MVIVHSRLSLWLPLVYLLALDLLSGDFVTCHQSGLKSTTRQGKDDHGYVTGRFSKYGATESTAFVKPKQIQIKYENFKTTAKQLRKVTDETFQGHSTSSWNKLNRKSTQHRENTEVNLNFENSFKNENANVEHVNLIHRGKNEQKYRSTSESNMANVKQSNESSPKQNSKGIKNLNNNTVKLRRSIGKRKTGHRYHNEAENEDIPNILYEIKHLNFNGNTVKKKRTKFRKWKIGQINVTQIEDLNNGTRSHQESLQHSCEEIRRVPIATRLTFRIDFRYEKYTEAYGIPIVGSYQVDDRAIKRACYLVRFMLADLKEARDSFYDRRGWVNILGANEDAHRLAKYCPLPHWRYGKHYVRAISPTWSYPVTTLPEENLLCIRKKDAMRNEDFGIHALAHAIHVIALRFVDPGFTKKLLILHRKAKIKGLWNNTYAIRNALEYWAEGVQSYFNANVPRTYTDSVHNTINTRRELEDYDPDLHNLIGSIFPCKNDLVPRCKDFYQEKAMSQELKVNYPLCLTESEAIKSNEKADASKDVDNSGKHVIYICSYVGISVALYSLTYVLINKKGPVPT